MVIRESAEMYLETILVLSKKGSVRSIDIANEMGFARPTVSVSVHNLANEDYIKINEDGTIVLKEKGKKIAETIYERHQVLSYIFEKIGVDKETAENDACKIEHVLSPITFECIKKALKKYEETGKIN